MDKRHKTGGRRKGTPNKISTELKTKISNLLSNNFEKLEKELQSMSGKDFVHYYTKLSEFVLPKMRSMEPQIVWGDLSESEKDEILNTIADKVKEEMQ